MAFQELFDLSAEIKSQGKTWESCSQAQLDELYDITDSYNTFAGLYAMEVLNIYFDESFYIPPAVGGTWAPRLMSISPEKETLNTVKVYPNPADQLLNVEILLSGQVDFEGTLQITDAQGKQIYLKDLQSAIQMLTINTSDWSSGMYQLTIFSKNSTWKESIEIVH